MAMIQVVCVKWGAKYGADAVNRLYRAVKRSTRAPFTFLCVSDQREKELDAGIVTRPFPEFSVPFATAIEKCRAKLAIFAPGVLTEGLPTVYFDLDTMVRGDIARIAEELVRRPGLYMLRNNLLRSWRAQRWMKAAGIDHYYFANSSVLAFYAEQTHFVFTEFNRLVALAREPMPKHLQTDERFLSWCARDIVRVLPQRLVVKFSQEYMALHPMLAEIRRRLPWVAARRRSLVAVTFAGNEIKPPLLAVLSDKDVLRRKWMRTRGPHGEYRDYWREPV